MDNRSQILDIDEYLKRPVYLFRQTGGYRKNNKRKTSLTQPLVTVITIVKNRKETLPQTIMSVLSQSYSNIEYIIVDGASTDGTLEVIKQFEDKIDLWVSEPDSGTSDAFNKAISMSGGDFIFWLAADDWIEPDFIGLAVTTFLNSGADFVFGNMVMYENGAPIVICKGNQNYVKLLLSGYPRFNFPTLVAKSNCYQKAGLMDMNFKLVADYEWILRLHLSGAKGFYNSSLVVHRRVGGLGERSPIQSALEHLRLLRKYGLPKSKAIFAYLYYSIRRILGGIVKLLLLGIIYKKLKCVLRRC